jgi:hypothetical protein
LGKRRRGSASKVEREEEEKKRKNGIIDIIPFSTTKRSCFTEHFSNQ